MVMRTAIALLAWYLSAGTCAVGGRENYYRLTTLPVPEDLRLEVSGLALLPDGRLAVAIRKGEIWILDNVHDDPPDNVTYHRFAGGLHEPLGLAWRHGAFYTVQRSELTRLRDTSGNGRADEYLTMATGWGLTGNYHEYAYGPLFDPAGNAWVTLNCTIGDTIGGNDAWRGWSLKVTPDGDWKPVSGGLRSPCGLGLNADGAVFASEQQGNWFAAGALLHLRKGVFHGHIQALRHCERAEATFAHPGEIPGGLTVVEAAQRVPAFTLPAVWFPYRKMGMSATDVLCDTTGGKFGPFENQLFVGEFTMSGINRVYLEKVNGQYQGACFPFLKDFQSGVLRMEWGRDGSMFAGQGNRGWNSLGTRAYGLQRVAWTGKIPFEIQTMQVRPDGFLLTFTRALDRTRAGETTSFTVSSYTYPYGPAYGGPEVDVKDLEIRRAVVSEDGRQVHLVVDGLREGYVHELRARGVRDSRENPLLHDAAYYTLNSIP
jgi:hypothetical protein